MNKKLGFTLVEIMIVVAIIGLLAAIAIPSFVKARDTSQKNACINNLRQVDGAKEQFALEHNMTTGDTPADADINDYIKGGAPECPSGGTYDYGAIGSDPTCTEEAAKGHVLP